MAVQSFVDIDRVAEGLWQSILAKPPGTASHQEWLALPEAEKQP